MTPWKRINMRICAAPLIYVHVYKYMYVQVTLIRARDFSIHFSTQSTPIYVYVQSIRFLAMAFTCQEAGHVTCTLNVEEK